MDITINISTEEKKPGAAEKLKTLRQPRQDKGTSELVKLMKKRLDRQTEPIGGSI